MMDIKTIFLACGLAFLLWSCVGVSAQEPAQMAPSAMTDTGPCYAAVLAQVRDAWPSLERFDRAVLAMQAIDVCEGEPQP